ncbi:MAG: acyl-CoA dehydrogenase family protein, partial [Actinomycetales bacterium]
MVDTAARTTTSQPAKAPASSAAPAASAAPQGAAPRVDVEALGRQLLGDWAEVRLAARKLSSRPEMQKVEGLTLDDQRARTFEQLKLLVADGQVHRAFPKSVGGSEDNGGNIAGFEELVAADPSLQIKSGVQWGLFGAAVMQLGTEYHHKKYLPGIMSLDVP